MPHVKCIEVYKPKQKKISSIEWHQLEEWICDLSKQDDSAVRLYGADNSIDASMILTYCNGFGYYISSYAGDDGNERFAADMSLPKHKVEVVIGGQAVSERRCVLVSQKVAAVAAKEFFDSGKLADEIRWFTYGELCDLDESVTDY